MSEKPLKYLFIVQGEGRGHMTQAISLYNILNKNGHEVSCVIVGKSKRREIPSFFTEKIQSEIYGVQSPNFKTDKNNKSINLTATIFYGIANLHVYIKSLNLIAKKVKEHKPDVIINFYDFLGGLYSFFYRPKSRFVCIGHQYLAKHPDFIFAKGRMLDKPLFRFNNFLTSLGADRRLALSFCKYPERALKRTRVTPPLLRKELFDLQAEDHSYILGYMVNSGYGEEIMRWHEKNSHIKLHCFWDKPEAPETLEVSKNLTFHRINDRKFLDYMSRCSGYVSTAGFESICEAFYLAKPVLMVPVDGQYEQACNAIDAKNAGIGIFDNEFDISKLVEYLPSHESHTEEFKSWLEVCEPMYIEELTQWNK
ncbi:MAG: glycosyltransferase family protein [Bacteroidota bacterium]